MTITETVLFYISKYEIGSGTFTKGEEQCFIVWTKVKRLC